MKTYKKTYEDVFSSKRSAGAFDPDKIILPDDLTFLKYVSYFNTLGTSFYESIFDSCVKYVWLKRNFRYKGVDSPMRDAGNGIYFDKVFSVFLREWTNFDFTVVTRTPFFTRTTTYLEELFPNFYIGDPFQDPLSYKFPYKWVNISHLCIVYQMDERIPLLDLVEKKNMKYNEFLDYVLNHCMSVNEDKGEEYYGMVYTNRCSPYIKKLIK